MPALLPLLSVPQIRPLLPILNHTRLQQPLHSHVLIPRRWVALAQDRHSGTQLDLVVLLQQLCEF